MNDVATTDRPPVLMVECHFPLLPKEQICISFQVLPIDAPQYFYERAHGEDAGERGVQAGNGELFEEYKNVKFDASSIKLLGLKPVDVYTKWKETPKGSRGVVYFWFAPEADYRNFQDPKFLSYTLSEFDRLASLVYVTGQSFVNPDGPACIVLKGVAQCSERTTLALVEGELEGRSYEVSTTPRRPI